MDEEVPKLCVSVSELISSGDWNEIRSKYNDFLEEGKALSDKHGCKIVEILDVGDVSLQRAVLLTPLLVELLRKGTEYDHAGSILLRNTPTWSATVWKTVVAAVPSIGSKNISFE